MKDTGKTESQKGKVASFIQMVISTLEIGRTIWLMALVFTSVLTVLSMSATGSKIRDTDKEQKNGPMAQFTMEITPMDSSKILESLCGPMEHPTLATL